MEEGAAIGDTRPTVPFVNTKSVLFSVTRWVDRNPKRSALRDGWRAGTPNVQRYAMGGGAGTQTFSVTKSLDGPRSNIFF